MKRDLILTIFLLAVVNAAIYDKLYKEAYKITQAMTLDQKIGQTIQAEFVSLETKGAVDPSLALKYNLGSVLGAGDSVPDANGNIVVLPIQQQKIKQIYLNGTLQNWNTLANKFNNIGPQVTTFEGKTYKIKLLVGTDAVHNNQHVIGTIIFPHNIGVSCSHNPTNFYNAGYWTGLNVRAMGFNYAFAPTVAVSHNPQWGRYYQTMGQQDNYILQYGKQFVRGVQNIDKNGNWNGALASVKHFFGDGTTLYGADEGDSRVLSFKSYIDHNTQGYKGAIQSEVGSVMISYSAINGVPNSINPALGNILRQKLQFDGFTISDYDTMNRISTQQLPTSFISMTDWEAYSTIMNNGMDMFMLPGFLGPKAISQYITNVRIGLLQNNTVEITRLDDAVTRILAVKLAMGLIVQTNGKDSSLKIVEQPQIKQEESNFPVKVTTEYQDALQAVRESLVLLKNDNKLLPLKNLRTNIQHIVLVGERVININHLSKNELFRSFDDIGMQCGGWTLRWQGFEGNELWLGDNKAKTNATSIVDALQNLNGKFDLIYPNYTTFTEQLVIDIQRTQFITNLKKLRQNMTAQNTLIIGVLGESPYAEMGGDINIPYCKNALGGDGCLYSNANNPYLPEIQKSTLEVDYQKFDTNVINTVREQDKNIPLITVLFSGRPMIINNPLNISTAFISAWLPGTSGGQGVIDAISGDYLLRPKGAADRTNTLSMDWPKDMASLANFPVYPADGSIPKISNPIFSVGHGLSTA